jgi:hypothetical protein
MAEDYGLAADSPFQAAFLRDCPGTAFPDVWTLVKYHSRWPSMCRRRVSSSQCKLEGVAQSVEHRTFNPWVLGSSPSTLTCIFSCKTCVSPWLSLGSSSVAVATIPPSDPHACSLAAESTPCGHPRVWLNISLIASGRRYSLGVWKRGSMITCFALP